MPDLSGRPALSDFLHLAAELEAAGHPHPVFTRAQELLRAMNEATRPEAYTPVGRDLINMTTEDVTDLVRQHVINRSIEATVHRGIDNFEAALLDSARNELAITSDDLISELRREFDPALHVITTAAARGITTTTTAAELIDQADQKTIAAYNQIPGAVETLDRVGRIRLDLARFGGVGPVDWPIASIVTGVDTTETLKVAAGIHTGRMEWVDVPSMFGPNRAPRPVARVGGAWLDLHLAGIGIRLNTAEEANAVVAATVAEAAA